MAPSITAVQILPSKQKNKLRKPIVEKMRRDRINSSIEKLKLLLEKEFKAQEANIKLEKADILETAVEYLARHRTVTIGQKSPQQDYREGFSHCLKEALLKGCFPSIRHAGAWMTTEVLPKGETARQQYREAIREE
ncbi:hypothetical protein NDU88_011057 [Pleurodeles waltl]|uniref:Transcription factor HES-5 n=1 Tax=Pleurodeles waltl TaxID=8319 RepID=A0AAV7QZX9_PLEWA|nr:hypothetical protein NDU88_011057 [Pleurodeles waltl]